LVITISGDYIIISSVAEDLTVEGLKEEEERERERERERISRNSLPRRIILVLLCEKSMSVK
jgi:hypothetical protein